MNRKIEFNNANDVNRSSETSLNGWFSGFCPSNGIASSLSKKAKSTIAEKEEWEKKYTSLENGSQAAEWGDLKNEVARLEKLIQAEKITLQQEKGIADALGLGAWCNGAVSKRKKAETALRDAEKALGTVKGSYQILERQQKDGITRASEVIENSNKTLQQIKQEVQIVKQKIAAYKVQRDAEKQAQAIADATTVNEAKKINTAGFLSKENMPLVIGGVLVAGTVLYFSNKNKELKRKSNIKKVKA